MDFIDLKSQQDRIKPELDRRIAEVLAHGQYILGPEVKALEKDLATFCGSKFALGCANGTDALILSLRALGIGPGDAVFCPSFTYCATAESIAVIGAHPVFVDTDRETYNLCPESLARTIAHVKAEGIHKPKAVIIVDLFGQCANYPALMPIARSAGLKVISDAAQGFGSTLTGRHPIHWADCMTTSFFPAKPLGCYGDGGAVFTNDPNIADTIESLRFHGRGVEKYDTVKIGLNSRLDTLQAAVLQCKLEIFEDEIESRNHIARQYTNSLRQLGIQTPTLIDDVTSTWAQYTIEVDAPDELSTHLREANIPSARYYPLPTHLQSIYKDFSSDPEGLQNTETCMSRVISLPMHPYLTKDMQYKVIDRIREFFSSNSY